MPNVQISQLPAAQTLDGTELVPIVQQGITVRSTTGAITASPNLQQTFLTLNQETTLPNSRRLSVSSGLSLTDGGALSNLNIAMTGTAASLNTASIGLVTKLGDGSVTPRSIAVSGGGLSISNGNGQSGNPTISLSGQVANFSTLSANGLVTLTTGGVVSSAVVQGISNQTAVTNGDGLSGYIAVGLANDPILPGNASVTLPIGTSAQQPSGSQGQLRFNSDTQTFDGYSAGTWRQFSLSGGVTSFSAGTTGFSPSSPSSGTVTLGGILNSSNGGTGASALTGYVKGNGTSPMTASATVPTSDLSGTISNAQLTNSSVTFNGVAVSLGSSGSIPIVLSNALTIGTGLSGASFDGSSAVTIAIDSTVATLTGTQTLTNKSISGSSNTLSNIGNSSLTNSSVTFNGSTVALGSSATITASTTNALTIGTGLSGSSFNGGSAVTIANTGVLSFSGGTTGLTPATSTSGNITLGGTLVAANGGTGQTTYTTGDILYASASTTLSKLAIGSTNYVLTSTGSAPQYVAQSTLSVGSASTATTSTNLAGGATGSIPYQSAAATTTFLVGNTSTTPQFVTSTGTGSLAQAPTLTSSTGSGSVVLATSPTLVTPALGTPSSGVVTNLTGTASININGTVGATTATTGAFTTISATGVITSTLATGTAPFTVASTTQVANLNAATAGTATNATNTRITAVTTGATNYLTFVTATSGNLPQLVNSSITVNAVNGTITGGISGGTF